MPKNCQYKEHSIENLIFFEEQETASNGTGGTGGLVPNHPILFLQSIVHTFYPKRRETVIMSDAIDREEPTKLHEH